MGMGMPINVLTTYLPLKYTNPISQPSKTRLHQNALPPVQFCSPQLRSLPKFSTRQTFSYPYAHHICRLYLIRNKFKKQKNPKETPQNGTSREDNQAPF